MGKGKRNKMRKQELKKTVSIVGNNKTTAKDVCDELLGEMCSSYEEIT